MFNRRRNRALYFAIGVGVGVLALTGAGTLLFASRRRTLRMRDVTAQAKRVIQRTTQPTPERTTTHHAKRSRANGHTRSHNARA